MGNYAMSQIHVLTLNSIKVFTYPLDCLSFFLGAFRLRDSTEMPLVLYKDEFDIFLCVKGLWPDTC